MSKTIMSRVVKGPFREPFYVNFVFRYLNKKSREHALARGHRMAVYANDLIGLSIYVHGVFEKEDIADLLQLMSVLQVNVADSSVIDVGANIGNHSIEFARHFGKVYAFEPNPHTFKLLAFNSDFHPNIEVFNHGLSDKDAALQMSEDIVNYGGSSAVRQMEGDTQVRIEVKRLDDVAADIPDIALIKIDVEGMELKVLQGAVETIRSHQPAIAFEQHAREFVGAGETPAIEFLRSLGYQMCVIETDRDRQSWIARRCRNVSELLFGRKDVRSVVLAPQVIRGTYNMIIALPETYLAQIGAARVT